MKTPNQATQIASVMHVKDTYDSYYRLSEDFRQRMLHVYEQFSSFKEKKVADWTSTFKVNKAHEVVNKILPRIMAKNPKWVVSLKTDEFTPEDRMLANGSEAKKERMEQLQEYASGIQDYLTYLFDTYGYREKLRVWAKNMLVYGISWAKVKYKYEITRTKDAEGKVVETVSGEYPTIDVKSWTEMHFDPRYKFFSDQPAIIEDIRGVRIDDLKRNKDEYFNLDLIESLPPSTSFANDPRNYSQQVFALAGIPTRELARAIDLHSLNLRVYQGYFSESPEYQDGIPTSSPTEKLYKITTVEDLFCIGFEEISQYEYEEVKAFDDVETHFATGLVEPILGLQEEMNFKKNSASEYVNAALNRSWIWSPNSGINPKHLVSKPGNIIVTSKTAEEAQRNLVELPMRELPVQYFNEQNDFERQIQGMTFTVDTSNPDSQQALTNTATGIRVKFFESNSVIDELRKHFEEAMENLAYRIIACSFENMAPEDNIVFKKQGTEEYWSLNRELLRDALNRYSIKVEVNSSSFDSIEGRRNDAIAFFNILMEAHKAGVPVNLEEGLREIVSTFEKKVPERFISTPQQLEQFPGMGAPAGEGSPRSVKAAAPVPSVPADITQRVAQGDITSATP